MRMPGCSCGQRGDARFERRCAHGRILEQNGEQGVGDEARRVDERHHDGGNGQIAPISGNANRAAAPRAYVGV